MNNSKTALYTYVRKPETVANSSRLVKCKEYAENRSIKVCQEYIDDSISNDRAFLQLIQDIEQGNVHTVIVDSINSISRKLKTLSAISFLVTQGTIRIISPMESFDTNEPAGQMLWKIHSEVRKLEEEKRQERRKFTMLSRLSS